MQNFFNFFSCIFSWLYCTINFLQLPQENSISCMKFFMNYHLLWLCKLFVSIITRKHNSLAWNFLRNCTNYDCATFSYNCHKKIYVSFMICSWIYTEIFYNLDIWVKYWVYWAGPKLWTFITIPYINFMNKIFVFSKNLDQDLSFEGSNIFVGTLEVVFLDVWTWAFFTKLQNFLIFSNVSASLN